MAKEKDDPKPQRREERIRSIPTPKEDHDTFRKDHRDWDGGAHEKIAPDTIGKDVDPD